MRILLVEDDSRFRTELMDEISGIGITGIKFRETGQWKQGLRMIKTFSPDLVLLDMAMPKDRKQEMNGEVDYDGGFHFMEGLLHRSHLADLPASPRVIVISSQGREVATNFLLKWNIDDYIFKDMSIEEIIHRISSVIEKVSMKQEIVEKDIEILKASDLSPKCADQGGLIIESKIMKEMLEKLKKVSERAFDSPILFTGETGCGKTQFAKLYHNINQTRKNKPFISINARAISGELFESELFGHVAGAFTGATCDKIGKMESADGGILFLDEVSEMTLDHQARILKAIEEKEFYPVGGSKPVKVDVQFIFATHFDLLELVEDGKFREDLYYRISTFHFEIPPLRERSEDIPALLVHFLNSFREKYARVPTGFSDECIKVLSEFSWPGNIRSLKNFLDNVTVMSDEKIISLETAKEYLPGSRKSSSQVTCTDGIPYPPEDILDYRDARQTVIEPFEEEFFKRMYKINDHNVSKTAKAIGYNRRDLAAKLKQYGIS